jgi:pyridoxal phosphate enzyme (YggS family)
MNRKTELENNLNDVKRKIATEAKHDVTLIVVTKSFPVSDVEILRELGVRDFGENRDADGAEKSQIVPATWHFQGQIQSNKLKSITQWAKVIHSLDDLRHFELIEKYATHALSIFLQVSLDGAHHRGGAKTKDLYSLAEAIEKSPKHTLSGIMAVPPLSMQTHTAYAQLQQIHQDFMKEFPGASGLSAGMSGDYEMAISYGATHVRVGSSILGSRSPQR